MDAHCPQLMDFMFKFKKLPVGWVRFIVAIAEINRNPTMRGAILGYAIANPTYT
jgi:hypothetical protein